MVNCWFWEWCLSFPKRMREVHGLLSPLALNQHVVFEVRWRPRTQFAEGFVVGCGPRWDASFRESMVALILWVERTVWPEGSVLG